MSSERLDVGGEWAVLLARVAREFAEWRRDHPQATLSQMEAALDGALERARAKILTEAAVASAHADWDASTPPEERPYCPRCGGRLRNKGKHPRRLQTHGGQEVVLERAYGACPSCGEGLFPPG